MADKLDGIIFSEVLADNAGASATDTDGDGRTNKADEFIELQNTTGAPISLSGFQLWSEKQGLLYSFGASATIAPGSTATVVGNYGGTPPPGYYSAGLAESGNWLPDGEGQKFDSLFLVNTATGEYITLSYGDPPRTPTLPSGFPGTTQLGAGESIDSNAPNGAAFARDANGDFQETTPTPGTPGVPCFTSGTLIQTERGNIAVEHLVPCDMVLTLDAGYVPLRAIRCSRISRAALHRDPGLRPIIFPAHRIGNARPLALSPSHSILIADWRADLLFGTNQVLVPAVHTLGHLAHQSPPTMRPLHYHHLAFDHHHVIRAEGAWVESLFLGQLARRELRALENWRIASGVRLDQIHHQRSARLVLKGFQARLLFLQTPIPVQGPLAKAG